ncbi:hypothetical protein WJX81_006133 [Elliptochloris bilobata]|uniref:PNPLA domain-containing protein n=1 Tax=Elliptochloris bilobata TaxID=381761 RepID=A0AAW1QKT4_9CHLO
MRGLSSPSFTLRRYHILCSGIAVVRGRGDIEEMAFAVRADLLRNLANQCNSELHEHFPVVPEPIREFIDEVKLHLEALTHAEEGLTFTLEHKMNFLRETRHAFGRTALVLSGGGALGAFHVGVVKALFEQNLLPRVLAGSSVGSIVASTIATRNDTELRDLFSREADIDLSFFSNSTASQFLSHFWSHGTLQDGKMLANRLKVLLGTSTFLQAFQHSGRVLNVAVCPADTNEPPRVLNYLTAPHVYVWSAVSCSSAFPLLFEPQELYARDHRGHTVKFSAEAMRESQRRWRDGSLEEDLPMRCLSEMFNVNYFLVSQTNPHIVPALNLKKRVNRKLGNLLESEWKHRCQQLMALVPSLRILKVFCQPWEGDVTMVLPSTYMQIKKSITNPTADDLRTACRQGEQSTWAKLSAIQANCGIETTLDACMVAASKMVAEGRAANARSRGSRGRLNAPARRARVPSWVNMSAIGLPPSASDDALDRSGGGSAGDLMVHARAGDEPAAPAPPNALGRSSVALSTAPLEPLDAVVEADNEAGGDSSSGHSGRVSPSGAALVSPFTASAFALEAMPPADSFRYPYGAEPEPPAEQAGDCCDESVQVGIWECLAQLARTSVREPTGVWAGSGVHASPSGQGLDYVEC